MDRRVKKLADNACMEMSQLAAYENTSENKTSAECLSFRWRCVQDCKRMRILCMKNEQVHTSPAPASSLQEVCCWPLFCSSITLQGTCIVSAIDAAYSIVTTRPAIALICRQELLCILGGRKEEGIAGGGRCFILLVLIAAASAMAALRLLSRLQCAAATRYLD